ncbi:MAG: hypothetical protein ACRDMV_21015 [Streptosporangiales bacterium]
MTPERREAREQLIDYLDNEVAVDWLIDHVETVARATGARVRTERYGTTWRNDEPIKDAGTRIEMVLQVDDEAKP